MVDLGVEAVVEVLEVEGLEVEEVVEGLETQNSRV